MVKMKTQKKFVTLILALIMLVSYIVPTAMALEDVFPPSSAASTSTEDVSSSTESNPDSSPDSNSASSSEPSTDKSKKVF